MVESVVYYIVKSFGIFIRALPVHLGLWIGRLLGRAAYYLDFKHKFQVYVNLKLAFANSKTPKEIKRITHQVFVNFGQNIIELLRLPLMSNAKFDKYITMEGREHISQALTLNKGVILLAMHYGSWEMGSLASAMMGHPYKVIVKAQKRFTRLDELLNRYRECSGSVTITRGIGTRDLIRSLQNNEIVAMVVDQGGKEGMLVPFFSRQASMSVGAIRIALKFGTPICFVVMKRVKGPYHRVQIHAPLEMHDSGDTEKDIKINLQQITRLMEAHILQQPAEYMWFYKIWKYSRDAVIAVLNDGRTGHLRQSQAVAHLLKECLVEKALTAEVKILSVCYRNPFMGKMISIVSVLARGFLIQGRLGFLRYFLTNDSFGEIMSVKADFIISCGSKTAGVNYLLASDQQAKSIVVLRPGLLKLNRFDLVILPAHDRGHVPADKASVIFTLGAPNLVNAGYLLANTALLLNRYSHLKSRKGYKLGFLLGGDTKDYKLNEKRIKMVIHQLTEVADELDVDIIATTSRRTSLKIENLLQRDFKKHPRCQLLVLANRNNIPEAVGGILGLSDIVVVSGDSISMISEAASSGKKTIVFLPRKRAYNLPEHSKHNKFIDQLNSQGYILSSDIPNLKKAIYDLAKNKIQTRTLNDNAVIIEGIKTII